MNWKWFRRLFAEDIPPSPTIKPPSAMEVFNTRARQLDLPQPGLTVQIPRGVAITVLGAGGGGGGSSMSQTHYGSGGGGGSGRAVVLQKWDKE